MEYAASLTDYVSVEVLEDILIHFYEASHLMANITDSRGMFVTDIRRDRELCKRYRHSPDYCERCTECNGIAGMQAFWRREPVVMICHAALCSAAAPVIIGDTLLGTVFVGQIRLEEKDREQVQSLEASFPMAREPWTQTEEYRDLLEQIPVVSLSGLRSDVSLLASVINHLVAQADRQRAREAQFQQERKLMALREETARERENQAKERLKNLVSRRRSRFPLEAVNSVYQQALIEGAGETADMLLAMIHVLKHEQEHPEFFVSVQEESDFIGELLKVYNMTHRYGILFLPEIDLQCREQIVTAAVVQPVLENLFISRLEKKDSGGKLSMVVTMTGERLRMSFASPQVSFPTAEIRGEADTEYLAAISPATALTIQLVFRALNLQFGDEFRLALSQSEDRGGEVIIEIPLSFSTGGTDV